jgi:diguanylate cyclase (GGDEF)-like protein
LSVHPSEPRLAGSTLAPRSGAKPSKRPKASVTATTHRELRAVRPPPAAEKPAVKISYEIEGENEEEERTTQISCSPPSADTDRDRVLLLRLDGVEAGSLTPLGEQMCTIGRHTSNEIQLDDPGVSRFHARITWVGNAHAIEDLASSNGTYLRGKRVVREVLTDGDMIQLGPNARFRYTVTDAKHEQLLRQLYESSTRDALTGLSNRRHFDERMRAELAYSLRHDTDLSVLLIDIDHFKKVNDAFGHAAGDAVIRHVAQVGVRQLRGEDLLARYGGEEFIVLLRGTSAANAAHAAERIRKAIAASSVQYGLHAIRITVSVGCASLHECSERTSAALVGLADERLYAAKHAGRNCVVSR